MRKFSLKTRANSRHKFGKFTKTALVSIGVAFLVLVFAKGFVATVSSAVTMPLYAVRNYIQHSSDTIPTYVRERATLDNEIQSLKQEIASQEGIKATLSFIEKENEELRALLGATNESTILAGVIARPPTSPYDTVVIDKGAADGIVSGAPVYYGAGMALGYVRVVYERHALVTLFSSPNVQTTVYVYGSNIFTTAYGEGGGIIRLSIPQGIPVAEGDVVVLPSLRAGVLGEVSLVQSIPTEPEQRAYVTFETPLQSIRLVRVGTEAPPIVTFDEALKVVREEEKALFSIPIPDEYQSSTSTATTSNGTATSTAERSF
jgi:cell shape-determining protein MreC